MTKLNRLAKSSVRRAIVFGIAFSIIFGMIAIISAMDLLKSTDNSSSLNIVRMITGATLSHTTLIYLFLIAAIGLVLTIILVVFGRRMILENDE
jgi:ABC-type Fe3+-siderophore transport system permease subunit